MEKKAGNSSSITDSYSSTHLYNFLLNSFQILFIREKKSVKDKWINQNTAMPLAYVLSHPK